MSDHQHAVRIAQRLAQHAARRGRQLRKGVIPRMWAILETHPDARRAFDCPPDRRLAEHAATLSPDEIEAATDRLRAATPRGAERKVA